MKQLAYEKLLGISRPLRLRIAVLESLRLSLARTPTKTHIASAHLIIVQQRRRNSTVVDPGLRRDLAG